MIYNKVIAYTDGSANAKSRLGGWGCYLQFYLDEELVDELKYNEGHIDTTVNRMELTGIISAMSFIESKNVKVEIISDSQICIKGINEWYETWIKENRVNIKNRDLWDILMDMKNKFADITFIHTRGHAKGEDQYKNGNDIVDKLADYRKLHNIKKDA